MNMKILRILIATLLLVLGTFLMISCGKDKPVDPDPTDGSGIAATTASTEAATGATDATEETGELVFDLSAYEDPTEAPTEYEDKEGWDVEEEEIFTPTEPPKTQQPNNGGTTQPTQPNNGGSTQPTQPSNGGAAQPTQPSNGGSTEPTQPSNGGATQPTQPNNGGSTEPTQPNNEPTQPPTQPPTEPPTESGNSGTQEPQGVTYEEYMAMSAAEQQAFINSFGSMEAFFDWFNAAKAEHDAKDDSIEVGDGNIDLGGGNNG